MELPLGAANVKGSRMSVDLPATGNQSARELVDWCSDLQLGRAIAYLELVRIGQINPGPELETVLGSDSLLTWTVEEIVAVQNKLALALCLRANPLTLQELGKRKLQEKALPAGSFTPSQPISDAIYTSVFKHRMEVLNSYNAGTGSKSSAYHNVRDHGISNSQGCVGSRGNSRR